MHGMTLLSFGLFRKNLGNLREFFGQMVHRPPGQKFARTPMSEMEMLVVCFKLCEYKRCLLLPNGNKHDRPSAKMLPSFPSAR